MIAIQILLLSLLCKCAVAMDIINAANFADTISSNKLVMVLFHAPWSGDSQDFMDTYENIATSLSDVDMTIGKVDVSIESELYDEEEIDELPVIKFYVGGEPIWYERDMNADDVTGYVRRLTESSLTTLDAAAGGFYGFAKEHLSESQTIAVLLLGPNSDSPAVVDLRANFDFACKKFYSMPCAVTNNGTLFQDEVNAYPSMVMVRKFPNESPLDVADESITSIDDILYWMQLAAFPRYSEFTERNEPTIYSLKRLGFSTHVITVVNTDVHSHSQGRDITDHAVATSSANANMDIFNMGKQVADEYRGQAVVSYVDTARSTPYTDDLLSRLEINPGLDLPMVLIAQAVDTHVNFYAYKSNVLGGGAGGSASSLSVPEAKDFVARFFADELFPTSRRRHDLPADIADLETDGSHPLTDGDDDEESFLPAAPEGVFDESDGAYDADFDAEELDNDRLLHHLMSF